MGPTSFAEAVRAADRGDRFLAVCAAAPAAGLAVAHWLFVHALGPGQGLALAASVFVLALAAGGVATLRRSDALAVASETTPDGGTASTDVDVAALLDHALSAPGRALRTSFAASAVALAALPLAMGLFGFDGWLSVTRFASAVAVALASAALGSLVVAHLVRRAMAPLVVELGDAAGEAAAGPRSARAPLRRKLALAIAVPAACAVVLGIDAFVAFDRAADRARAAEWAALALEAVAKGDADLPLSARVATVLPSEALRPFPVRIVELDPSAAAPSEGVEVSTSVTLDGAVLDDALDSGAVVGRLASGDPAHVVVFRRSGDRSVLVASVEPGGGAGSVPFGYLVVALLLVASSLGLARGVAADLGEGCAALDDALERLLAGDLSARVAWASDDELGHVAASMARVGHGLRATVERVSATAECAESAVVEATSALSELRACGASQVELLQHVDQMMAMVGARVGEASQAATELAATIEESGSSLLELGAAGDELNQTAGVLTSKVDAVSDSLEQIVRSGKQIAGTTEKLSSASDDTSSSMEEMAAAMRAVDISAEATAQLSRDVVEKAEEGQDKVVQTIEGMDAIRSATDLAEQVIRGLGARTQEIGGILDVIDDVTDETNLLALNAAIIAAQAGEHGRAFSVVADEIKELADRVVASTTEIAGLIRALQTESENAIGAIEAGSKSVMSGVDLSAEAGRTLEAITVASRESGTRISDIVTAVREQTNAATHVVQLMERVRESTEEIGTASAEQDQGNEVVSQSTQAMREVALLVRRTTEEQARGLGRIRENVVGVKEAVEQITGSLDDQSTACREVADSLGRASKGAEANDEAAGRLERVIRELESRASELREEVAQFRVA